MMRSFKLRRCSSPGQQLRSVIRSAYIATAGVPSQKLGVVHSVEAAAAMFWDIAATVADAFSIHTRSIGVLGRSLPIVLDRQRIDEARTRVVQRNMKNWQFL